MEYKWLAVLVFSAVVLASGISSVVAVDDSPWTYVCRNKFCSKVFHENVSDIETSTQTPEVCKLNCGDHGSLWPIPTGNVTLAKDVVAIEKDVTFNLAGVPAALHDWLNASELIFENYLAMMNSSSEAIYRSRAPGVKAARFIVEFVITSPSKQIGIQTNESYELTVATVTDVVNVRITAPTYFGARHGLETLSQLIAYDEAEDSYVAVSSASIKDKPIYPYRGIMMDTSRNFVPLDRLKNIINAISYNKLNVFHWHITDTHSFPMEVPSQPNLTKYGAYSSKKIYSIAEMTELVTYAKIRGVKIVPEFDEPAHVGNGWIWGDAGEDLAVCVNKDYWHQYCVEPPCGQLNPINNKIYPILRDIFRTMTGIFDKDIFHMGGDEVDLRCYNSTPAITSWMAEQGWDLSQDSFMKLWNHFQTNAYEQLVNAIADHADPNPEELLTILWTSELTSEHYIQQYINETKYAVQIWTEGNDAVIPFLINNKYRVIFSNVNAWYLDCGFHNWILDSGHNWCSPFKTWQQVYENSPFKIYANWTSADTANQAIEDGLILGGIAPLWSEQVDGDALEARIWPRGAALAERLWADPRTTGALEATTRMVNNRQRLSQRGVQANRLQPEWCYQNENKCTGEGLASDPDPNPNGGEAAAVAIRVGFLPILVSLFVRMFLYTFV